jgi:tetrapyrrole methylase family protein/MazG family protein
MTITILGLGPGGPELLTREAWDLLNKASTVYLRTRLHPTVAELPGHLDLHSFDSLYETAGGFSQVYTAIAERILWLVRDVQDVLYAVPGHPLIAESSVTHILALAKEERIAVRIVEGLSFVEPTLSLLGVDGLMGLQLADAIDIATAYHPHLDPDCPALIGQLYGSQLASDLKLSLMNVYPADHKVVVVRAAGTADATTAHLPLYRLDRDPQIDHLTTLYVPALPYTGGLPGLQATVARLRAPDGCPWDREQTHQSLRADLLEETHEVLAALDRDDLEKLCEELGDLLMQVALQVQIATEDSEFLFVDVIRGIDTKLKRRHPHVFGEIQVEGTAEVLKNWEAIKASERATRGDALRSRLDGLPKSLPALARAQSISDRAARGGLQPRSAAKDEAVVAKLMEELKSVTDRQARVQLLGNWLFAVGIAASELGLDAESALRIACDRFTDRFSRMERRAQEQGLVLSELAPSQIESLWDESGLALEQCANDSREAPGSVQPDACNSQ